MCRKNPERIDSGSSIKDEPVTEAEKCGIKAFSGKESRDRGMRTPRNTVRLGEAVVQGGRRGWRGQEGTRQAQGGRTPGDGNLYNHPGTLAKATEFL